MTGALIELVTNVGSPHSQWLTDDPQITFFKFVFRRHTNFSVENIPVSFNNEVGFGRTLGAVLPRKGDLVGKVIFQADIDQVKPEYPRSRTEELRKLISEHAPELLSYFEPRECLADIFPALERLIELTHHEEKEQGEILERLGRSAWEGSGDRSVKTVPSGTPRDDFYRDLAERLVSDSQRGTFHLIQTIMDWHSTRGISPSIYSPRPVESPSVENDLPGLLRETTPMIFFQKLRSTGDFTLESREPRELSLEGELMLDTNYWNKLISRAPNQKERLEEMVEGIGLELRNLTDRYQDLFSRSSNLFFANSLPASGMYSYLGLDPKIPVLNLTVWYFYFVRALVNISVEDELFQKIRREVEYVMHDASYLVNDIFANSAGGMGSYYPGSIEPGELVLSISLYRSLWPSLEEIFDLINQMSHGTVIGEGFREIHQFFLHSDQGGSRATDRVWKTELGQKFSEEWSGSLDQMSFYFSVEAINRRAQDVFFSPLPLPPPEAYYRLTPGRYQSRSYLETSYTTRFGQRIEAPVPSPFEEETVGADPRFYTRDFYTQTSTQPVLLPKVVGSRPLPVSANGYFQIRHDWYPVPKETRPSLLEVYPDDTLRKALSRCLLEDYGEEVVFPERNLEAARKLYWDYLQAPAEKQKVFRELVWWVTPGKNIQMMGADVVEYVNRLVEQINQLRPQLEDHRESLERWQPWLLQLARQGPDAREEKVLWARMNRDGLAFILDSDLPYWLYCYLLYSLEYPPVPIDLPGSEDNWVDLLRGLMNTLIGLRSEPLRNLEDENDYLARLREEKERLRDEKAKKMKELLELRYEIAEILLRDKTPRSAWTERLGHVLVERATFQIVEPGEKASRKELSYGTDWMEVRSRLTSDPARSPVYDRMIGHLPELCEYTPAPKPAFQINLPLLFHFCQHPGQSLPLISSLHTQHQFQFQIRSFRDLFYHQADARVNTPPKIQARLMVDYVFLSSPERQRFLESYAEYLIEEIQEETHSVSSEKDSYQIIDHNFFHPARGLIVLTKLSSHRKGQGENYFPGEKQWTNYSYHPLYSHERLRRAVLKEYRKLAGRFWWGDRWFGLARTIDSLVGGSENAKEWHGLKEILMVDGLGRNGSSLGSSWRELVGDESVLLAELSEQWKELLDTYRADPMDYPALLDSSVPTNPLLELVHLANGFVLGPGFTAYHDSIHPYHHAQASGGTGINCQFWAEKPFQVALTGSFNLTGVESFQTQILPREGVKGELTTILMGINLVRYFSGIASIGWP